MPRRPCSCRLPGPSCGMLCFRRCPLQRLRTTPPILHVRPASRTVDEFCHRAIRRELDAPGLAMLDSHSGPHAASVFTTRPVSPELSFSSPFFRVLLLRRLRLPLPLTAARCRCRQPHDFSAACPRSGATVALNVRLRDLNIDAARQDDRRIEVMANGLALWGGGGAACS